MGSYKERSANVIYYAFPPYPSHHSCHSSNACFPVPCVHADGFYKRVVTALIL
jgi:hypothetical protein